MPAQLSASMWVHLILWEQWLCTYPVENMEYHEGNLDKFTSLDNDQFYLY